MDRGAWQATVHGLAKSWDMTEQLSIVAHILTAVPSHPSTFPSAHLGLHTGNLLKLQEHQTCSVSQFSHSVMLDSATPWTAAHQAFLSGIFNVYVSLTLI